MYVHPDHGERGDANRALKAFFARSLKSGEKKSITLSCQAKRPCRLGATQEWKVEPGEFTVTVGAVRPARTSAKFIFEIEI